MEKYDLYLVHHDNKTLGQFFPPLYEEYFTQWPPTPSAEVVKAAKDITIATAQARTKEENVRDFDLPK